MTVGSNKRSCLAKMLVNRTLSRSGLIGYLCPLHSVCPHIHLFVAFESRSIENLSEFYADDHLIPLYIWLLAVPLAPVWHEFTNLPTTVGILTLRVMLRLDYQLVL